MYLNYIKTIKTRINRVNNGGIHQSKKSKIFKKKLKKF